MAIDAHVRHPVGKAHVRELRGSLSAPVGTLLQRDAVDMIEKRPHVGCRFLAYCIPDLCAQRT
jgi:hypothetical protein